MAVPIDFSFANTCVCPRPMKTTSNHSKIGFQNTGQLCT